MKFWTQQFPELETRANKLSASKAQSENALAQLEDLEIPDIVQILLLCNPVCSIKDINGQEIKLDGSWRMKMVKGRVTFFPCS